MEIIKNCIGDCKNLQIKLMINYLKNKSLMLMSQKEYIRLFWKKEFIIFMRSQKRFKCDKHDLPSMQINKIPLSSENDKRP